MLFASLSNDVSSNLNLFFISCIPYDFFCLPHDKNKAKTFPFFIAIDYCLSGSVFSFLIPYA